jgi:hypothetical protein
MMSNGAIRGIIARSEGSRTIMAKLLEKTSVQGCGAGQARLLELSRKSTW